MSPLESVPAESGNERHESFDDFNIEIGDRVYSSSGAFREVTGIIRDAREDGGGYITAIRTDATGNKLEQIMTFGMLVKRQAALVRIDKPPLPVVAATVSPREGAALKQLDGQLQDVTTTDDQRNSLLRQRARLLWQIHDRQSKS